MNIYANTSLQKIMCVAIPSCKDIDLINPDEVTEGLCVLDNTGRVDIDFICELSTQLGGLHLILDYTLDEDEVKVLTDGNVVSHIVESFDNIKLHEIYEIVESGQSTAGSSKVIKLPLRTRLEYLGEFLHAINSSDIELIKSSFEGKFDSFKDVCSEIGTLISESKLSTDENANLKDKLNSTVSELKAIKSKYQKLVTDGKELEDKSNSYLDEIDILTDSLNALKAKLESSDSMYLNLETIKKELDIKCRSLETELASVRAREQSLNNSVLKYKGENDKLLSTINNLESYTPDTELKLITMGSVSKVVYIKWVDPIPYIVNALRLYARKIKAGYNCKAGIVILHSPDSVFRDIYETKAVDIKDNTVYKDCDSTVYTIEGMNENMRDYIENCECDLVFVLDMTFSSKMYLDCAGMNILYTANSQETLDAYALSPSICFTQNRTLEGGIQIPYVETYRTGDASSTATLISKLSSDLFLNLDKIWR